MRLPLRLVRLVKVLALILVLFAVVPDARAHDGLPPHPHDLWTSWNSDPVTLAAIAIPVLLYVRGWSVKRQRLIGTRGINSRHHALFFASQMSLAAALLSPLDALGTALFSAHMVQHMLLSMVVPPMLVLAAPWTTLLWGLPLPWRRAYAKASNFPTLRVVLHVLTIPEVAWCLCVAVVWLWHVPALYQAALIDGGAHTLEHLCFFGTSLLYWSSLGGPFTKDRVRSGIAVVSLFAMAMQGAILGAFMTFSPFAWYPAYRDTVVPWGMTPIQDQQLAGLVMWLPPGILYTGYAMLLLLKWLQSSEHGKPAELPIPDSWRHPIRQQGKKGS